MALKARYQYVLRRFSATMIAVTVISAANPACAQDSAEFFRGKVLNLIVSVQQGSPYDLTARNLIPTLRKYLPGNPTIIPQNMPGASSGRAAEFTYNVAPRDGTTLLIASPYIVLTQILHPSVKFKVQDFVWLGRIAPLTQVGIVWHTAPVNSIKDAQRREIAFGAGGATGPSAMILWAMNRLVGTKFKVVHGYVGEPAEFLALQRGEIEGMGSVSLNVLMERGWIAQNKVRILYNIATRRTRALPDIPTVVELAKNDHDRTVLGLINEIPDIGLNLIAPPNVPRERAATLRRAFMDAVKDPDFVSVQAKIHIQVEPLSGEDVESMVHKVALAPKTIVDAFRAATAPTN